jgi:hypothetical protein
MGSSKGGGGSRPKPPKGSSSVGSLGSGVAVAPPPGSPSVPVGLNAVALDQDPGWGASQSSVQRSATGLGNSFQAGGSSSDPQRSEGKEVAVRAAGVGKRLVESAKTTPGRLSLALTAVAISAIVLSLLAATATVRRSGVAKDLRDRKAAVVLDLLSFDASIREADAAATTGFLAGGVEPTKQRKRYDDAIASATKSLASVSASIEPKNRKAVAAIAAKLPEYTALVATARANNRQGFPSGSAYIRASSVLLREQVLPNTVSLEQSALRDFKARYGDLGVGGFLAAFLALGTAGLVGLLLLQKWISHKFRRRFNLGLLGATISLVVAMGISLITASGQVSRAAKSVTEGLRPSLNLASGRAQIFSAKADDALGLIGRGNADSSFDSARATLNSPNPANGFPELLDPLAQYVALSAIPRDLATVKNDYAEATDEANSEAPDSMNVAFDVFAAKSQNEVDLARNAFTSRMDSAIGTPRNRAGAIVSFVALSSILAAWGIRMRQREYQ